MRTPRQHVKHLFSLFTLMKVHIRETLSRRPPGPVGELRGYESGEPRNLSAAGRVRVLRSHFAGSMMTQRDIRVADIAETEMLAGG